MRRGQLKSIVGWLIIFGHLSIGAAVLFARDDVFDFSQKISIILVLSPVFSVYFISVVRSFIEHAETVALGKKVNLNFVGVAVLLPAIQLFGVHYLVYSYPSSFAVDTASLQRWISGMEVFLGGTVGLLVDDLFPKKANAEQ